MANHHAPADADPKEIERAQDMWARFTLFIKYGIGANLAALFVLLLIYMLWA